jgi:hypothetical protein
MNWHYVKRQSESDALFTDDNNNGQAICVRGGRRAGYVVDIYLHVAMFVSIVRLYVLYTHQYD